MANDYDLLIQNIHILTIEILQYRFIFVNFIVTYFDPFHYKKIVFIKNYTNHIYSTTK